MRTFVVAPQNGAALALDRPRGGGSGGGRGAVTRHQHGWCPWRKSLRVCEAFMPKRILILLCVALVGCQQPPNGQQNKQPFQGFDITKLFQPPPKKNQPL